MQIKGRLETLPSQTATNERITVPLSHWNDLSKRDISKLCRTVLAKRTTSGAIQLRFLKDELRIDLKRHCIYRLQKANWKKTNDPYLELICLVYLLNAGDNRLLNEMVGANDLKDAHFFQGPHALRTDALVKQFGKHINGFKQAAEALGGRPVALADAAYILFPFQNIPLYYLLWEGDVEFEPGFSILFDRSIESHLPADAIWGLINWVSRRLLSVQSCGSSPKELE